MAVNIKEFIPNVEERPRVRITSDKFKQEFLIKPTNDGFIFYEVTTSKGPLPKELSSKFTRMKEAVDAVIKYERKAKDTPTVKRDKIREERNAAKIQRDSTEHVRTGADN
jgi:hypothetical protein